jgi:hypothetical protein
MADPTPWIVAEEKGDVRKHAPATLRNREAIAAILVEELPVTGLVLELASGSGEHVAHFARELPGHHWQPSDPDASARASIAAWCDGLTNVLPPLDIDAAAATWPITHADAMLCVNMVHISPWEATLGLLAGASRLLPVGAPLIVYGPFLQADVSLAPSNAAFDESLRGRDPRWGLRSVEAIRDAAFGLSLDRIVAMPANNLTLVFRRG